MEIECLSDGNRMPQRRKTIASADAQSQERHSCIIKRHAMQASAANHARKPQVSNCHASSRQRRKAASQSPKAGRSSNIIQRLYSAAGSSPRAPTPTSTAPPTLPRLRQTCQKATTHSMDDTATVAYIKPWLLPK